MSNSQSTTHVCNVIVITMGSYLIDSSSGGGVGSSGGSSGSSSRIE